MNEGFAAAVNGGRLSLVEDGDLDPLRVADIYRRNAAFPKERILAREISVTLYNIGAAISYLGMTKPLTSNDHTGAEEQAVAIFIADLATRAKMAGAKSILFPVHQDYPLGQKILGVIGAYNIDSDFKFLFRTTDYDLDISRHGRIDPSKEKNPLAKNGISTMIGFWEISSDLKDKWDEELAALKPQNALKRRASRTP